MILVFSFSAFAKFTTNLISVNLSFTEYNLEFSMQIPWIVSEKA